MCRAPTHLSTGGPNVNAVHRDNELGEYLQARRHMTTPSQAGLATSADRRVPGLRREEVALLAGISTDYYTRLEQGRERHPSDQVRHAIARALQLDEDAAAHLYRLGLPAPAAQEARTVVSDELLHLLDGLRDSPAFIVGPAQDILAANTLADALYAGFTRFDNLLRMIFLDPVAREFYLNWPGTATTAVANLRVTAAQFPGDARVERIVGELSLHSPAFTDLWGRHEIRPRTQEDKHFRHPQVGELHLHFEALAITSAPGQHLSVYSAMPGSATADALILLRGLADPRTDQPEGNT